jgi:hypothetical protein
MSMWDRAAERLTLEPIFGPKAWGANSTCADVHPGGPIPAGSRCCCMHCFETGVEHHPDLRETAADKVNIRNWRPTDEAGNPTPDQWSIADTAEPTRYRPDDRQAATRRQRRARQFRPQVERPD